MWVFYSAFLAAMDLQRTCSKCGRKQKVKMAQKGKTVPCNKCGANIPPPKDKV